MRGDVRGRGKATLSDVASVAGTSIPTVSKVLRGGTDVSPATRDRVMDAIRAVGYARGLKGTADNEQAALIDLVVNHVNGTWANGVLTGVESAATAANVDVVISIARETGDWVSRLLRPSRGAIVVLVDPTSSQFSALKAAGIPVVLVTPMSEPRAAVPRVGVTNWDGGRTAAEHLLSLGHHRFGIVAGERSHLYSRARVDGFRSALNAAWRWPVHGGARRLGSWRRRPGRLNVAGEGGSADRDLRLLGRDGGRCLRRSLEDRAPRSPRPERRRFRRRPRSAVGGSDADHDPSADRGNGRRRRPAPHAGTGTRPDIGCARHHPSRSPHVPRCPELDRAAGPLFTAR